MIVNCAIVTNKVDYIPNLYINRIKYPMFVTDLIAKVNNTEQTVLIVEFLNENFIRLGIDGQYIQIHVIPIGRKLELGDTLSIDVFNIKIQVREIIKL